jgi:hypothetical protein
VVRTYKGCFFDGLHFITARHFAFIDDDGVHWDYAETMDDSIVLGNNDNPWAADPDENRAETRYTSHEIWDKLPENNKAWFEIEHILPFENVLDIDDKGDDWAEIPHVYTTAFHPANGPFRPHVSVSLQTIDRFGRRFGEVIEDNRVPIFPRKPKT